PPLPGEPTPEVASRPSGPAAGCVRPCSTPGPRRRQGVTLARLHRRAQGYSVFTLTPSPSPNSGRGESGTRTFVGSPSPSLWERGQGVRACRLPLAQPLGEGAGGEGRLPTTEWLSQCAIASRIDRTHAEPGHARRPVYP